MGETWEGLITGGQEVGGNDDVDDAGDEGGSTGNGCFGCCNCLS